MLYKPSNFSPIFFSLLCWFDHSEKNPMLGSISKVINSECKNYVICVSYINLRPLGPISEIDWWQVIFDFGPASARSYKIGVVGNNWLVDNAVFSETALRIFLIFCMKLGYYKGRKVTGPDVWKKIRFGGIREKVSKLVLVGWLVTQFS